MTLPELTEPERLLCEVFETGAWLDLRAADDAAADISAAATWDPGRLSRAQVIRAQVIRALLLSDPDRSAGSIPAVRLRGARITGRLDLMGASISWPLVCEYCYFDQDVRLVEASTRTVRIVESFLPSVNATRLRLDGILNLWHCTVPGVVRLDQAKVTGQVCLRGARIGTPGASAEAVSADGLTVAGGVDAVDLRTHGSVSMQVAVVSGSVDLTGSRLTNPQGRALVASQADIGGQVTCRGMTVMGETRMHNCRIAASLGLQGATLSNPGGLALSAGGLDVGGGVFCTDGFSSAGEIMMIGAHLRANLTLSDATLTNPDGVTLNLDQATVRSARADGLTSVGQIRLVSTQFDSDLDLAGARLQGSAGLPPLSAERASIGGALVLARVHATGELSLRSIQVGQRVLLMEARLENSGGIACRMSRAHIAADVFFIGMTATGGIRLVGATIGAEVNFMRAQISNPGGVALDAQGLRAAELSLRTAEPVLGLVNLRHAHVSVVRDDPDRWPGALSLDGLTFSALEPPLPARQRLSWLARDPGGHQPQPYEQLAAYYTAIGQPAQARSVLYARERVQAPAKAPLARAWSLLQDVTVGFGYKRWCGWRFCSQQAALPMRSRRRRRSSRRPPRTSTRSATRSTCCCP